MWYKTVFLLLPLFGLQGVPIGNPTSPFTLQEGVWLSDTTWCQPKLSFYGDALLYQRLVPCRHSPSLKKISLSGTTPFGAIAWSILERFDLLLVAGCGAKQLQFVQNDLWMEALLHGGWSGYGEAKIVVMEIEDTLLSGFGQVGGSLWMRGPFYANELYRGNAQLNMRFWSAGVSLCQQIGLLSPYGGVIVMRSNWKLVAPGVKTSYFHEKYAAGPFLGASIGTGALLLNVEWRGWVENALSVSGEMRF